MPPFSNNLPPGPDHRAQENAAVTQSDRPRRRDLRSADVAPPAGRSIAVPLLSVLVGVVIIALALTLLWGLGRGDAAGLDEPEQAAGVPGASAVATPDDDAPPTEQAADVADDDAGVASDNAADDAALAGGTSDDVLARAVAELDMLAQSSTCDSMYADAGRFHDYAATAAATGAWPDLVSARRPAVTLEAIAERCDERYADRLTRYIVDDPQTDELLRYTLQDHLAELPQHHPAPSDALDLEMFHAAGGTIDCTLTYDGAGCAVTAFSFDDPPACLDADATSFSVAVFAAEVFPCAGTITGGATALADGHSTAVGDYACTAIDAGVRCWHTVSGTAFELSGTEVTLP